MLSSENNDNPLRRQQRAERNDQTAEYSLDHGRNGTHSRSAGGTLAQSVGWLPLGSGEKRLKPHTQ